MANLKMPKIKEILKIFLLNQRQSMEPHRFSRNPSTNADKTMSFKTIAIRILA
jgi:hypothetical protein